MERIWEEYYTNFNDKNYPKQEEVRDGCHPWLMTGERKKVWERGNIVSVLVTITKLNPNFKSAH